MSSDPPDWMIVGADGEIKRARGRIVSMTVAAGGRIFKRNFKKPHSGAHARILVGELDGVRVYLAETPDGKIEAVLTKEDVYL